MMSSERQKEIESIRMESIVKQRRSTFDQEHETNSDSPFHAKRKSFENNVEESNPSVLSTPGSSEKYKRLSTELADYDQNGSDEHSSVRNRSFFTGKPNSGSGGGGVLEDLPKSRDSNNVYVKAYLKNVKSEVNLNAAKSIEDLLRNGNEDGEHYSVRNRSFFLRDGSSNGIKNGIGSAGSHSKSRSRISLVNGNNEIVNLIDAMDSDDEGKSSEKQVRTLDNANFDDLFGDFGDLTNPIVGDSSKSSDLTRTPFANGSASNENYATPSPVAVSHNKLSREEDEVNVSKRQKADEAFVKDVLGGVDENNDGVNTPFTQDTEAKDIVKSPLNGTAGRIEGTDDADFFSHDAVHASHCSKCYQCIVS